MTTSAFGGIPVIPPGGVNQPETLHNEAIFLLEALAAAVAIGFSNSPPDASSPEVPVEDGDVWIVGTAGAGDYLNQNNKVVLRYGGANLFWPDVNTAGANIPIGSRHKGVRFYIQNLDAFYLWNGSAWVAD